MTPAGGDPADWRRQLNGGVNSGAEAAARFGGDAAALAAAERAFPVRINSYYASLIRDGANDPLGRQVIPSALELSGADGTADPLGEEADSPVPHLVHRYPDRVLFLVSYQCAVYCRFCTRKRAVGRTAAPTDDELKRGVEYIRSRPEIRDVIVSGGDPFLLADERLSRILGWLREIPHVEILRVDTRVPCVLPSRVTDELCRALAARHPLFVNTHFNHPREVTPEARAACERLVDHGIPVGNQTVLLRGVNDDPAVVKALMQKLLAMRVRPYYLYQCDPVAGADHFRTGVDAGLRIMAALRGHTSGMAVPTYVIDAPGGGGKVPLLPEGVVEISDDRVVVRNHEGRRFTYTQAPAATLLK
ncbi:MAG: KamA family radical SAM protein [Candidatus Coatesbacteria bacterium]